MPNPQKTKGKGYENDVAKFLTETYGDKFIRVPSSGAYLGGSNFDRRHTMTEGQIRSFKGDIIPPDSWNRFNCEAKFYKDFKFHLLYTSNITLDSWILETETAANPGDISIIFMKFNRIGEYVAYQANHGFETSKYTTYNPSWHLTSKTQFWTPHNTQLLKTLCTNSTQG
jgi:hypothetical protein